MVISTTPVRDRIADSMKTVDNIIAKFGNIFPTSNACSRFTTPVSPSSPNQRPERNSSFSRISRRTTPFLNWPFRSGSGPTRLQSLRSAGTQTIPIPAASKAADVTPVLEMKAYDDILSTITAMAHGIDALA